MNNAFERDLSSEEVRRKVRDLVQTVHDETTYLLELAFEIEMRLVDLWKKEVKDR